VAIEIARRMAEEGAAGAILAAAAAISSATITAA